MSLEHVKQRSGNGERAKMRLVSKAVEGWRAAGRWRTERGTPTFNPFHSFHGRIVAEGWDKNGPTPKIVWKSFLQVLGWRDNDKAEELLKETLLAAL